MRFRIITLLLFFALGKAFSQGNSIYQIAPQPVCWTTDEGRDSNLIAYWIFSPTQPRPKVVSYLVADGSQIVVSGGTLQNGFCCCNSNQDTIGITINGDTLILVQNGETYTYIGGGGDDDWRWVDPGAQENMYEAIYRMGKASMFTQDTTYGFQVDSTFRFRTNGGQAIFEWVRGNLKVPEKTWLFRAPGGGTGASQDDQNSITIARTNLPTTRTTLGKLRFASAFGVGDSLRVGAQIDALDEEGGGATSNVSLNFYTRQLGESFMRNTVTIEGNGRFELDRYNLFSDGVPANFLGYDVTDKDVKRHPISGTPQANFVPGINATNTGLEWKDPSTFGPTAVNIYNSDGSIPAAVNRVVTVPTDGNVSFVRGNYTLGYQTTGLGSAGTGQGWASKFSTSATNFAEVWAGTQISVRSGFRTRSSSTQNLFEATNALAYFESRNTGTNNGSSFQATTTEALMSYFASGSSVRGFSVNSSNIFAYETSSGNFVTYPSLRPVANSFWRYNSDGTGQYVNAASIGATDLTFSGSSSPVTLNSSTGTDVTLTAGPGISFSQSGNNLTITNTVSPVDSSIYKLLPLGDVTVLTNENTLTFNTGHEAGDFHSTMRLQTDYDNDDFQGRLINFVNTASNDSCYFYWFDGAMYYRCTNNFITSTNMTGETRLDSALTVRRSTGGPGAIRFEENPINGNNYYEWTSAPNMSSNVSSKWPTNNNTGVLFNDGSGNTSWATYTPVVGGLFSGTTDVNGVISVTLSGTPSIGACTCTNNATTPASFRYIFSATFTGGTGVTVRVYDTDNIQMAASVPVNFSLICR